MEKENVQIEQQNLHVETEVNEEKIALSDKSDQLMKKSITYLTIGFWTIVVMLVFGLISVLLVNDGKGKGSQILTLLFGDVVVVFLLIKMYAYIGNYKKFRKSGTQQALEDLLDAQKGYYGWAYILPFILIILIGLALVAFIIGDLSSSF